MMTFLECKLTADADDCSADRSLAVHGQLRSLYNTFSREIQGTRHSRLERMLLRARCIVTPTGVKGWLESIGEKVTPRRCTLELTPSRFGLAFWNSA